MFKNRNGVEPVGEGNDLLPSDQSEIVPTEEHWSAFVSLSVYILCKAEFASMWGSHFDKEMPFFCFPLGN